MEYFLALILLVMSPDCKSKNDFSIVRAESQSFAGGTVWSPSGTHYTVELKAERKLVNVKFLSVWIGEKRIVDIQAISNNTIVDFSDLSQGESVILTFSVVQTNHPPSEKNDTSEFGYTPDHPTTTGDDIQPPVKYSGAALISYLVKGKKMFLEIPEFAKQKPLLRP